MGCIILSQRGTPYRGVGRNEAQCRTLELISLKLQELRSIAVCRGSADRNCALGSGCHQFTVTWQGGSCGDKCSALTFLLPSL